MTEPTFATLVSRWYQRERPRPAVARARHQRLGRSWSARSCSSRHRWSGCCPPGRRGWPAGPTPAALAADTPGRGDPDVGPARLPPPGGAAARVRGGDRGPARRRGAGPAGRNCSRCPASARTRPGRSPRSRTGSGTRWSTPTSAGWCARAVAGEPDAGPATRPADLVATEELLPGEPAAAALASAAFMELGAVVCTARSPRCADCPVESVCAWRASGQAAPAGPTRRPQRYAGTDRQVRGLLLAVLREATGPVPRQRLDQVWTDDVQRRPGAGRAGRPTGWSSRSARRPSGSPATAPRLRRPPP